MLVSPLLAGDEANLSSALRVFVLEHFRATAEETRERMQGGNEAKPAGL
jgi:predicted DNA-binding ribbon-helix-helix protein